MRFGSTVLHAIPVKGDTLLLAWFGFPACLFCEMCQKKVFCFILLCFLYCMAGAGSAKLSYVLLQKLLKLAEFLPQRRDPAAPAADSTPAGSDANGNTSNGNSSNGNINGSTSNGNTTTTSSSSNGIGGSGGGNGSGGFCFKYVITDFSHANFGFWMNHPRLQELFTLGVIDFAVFDAEAGKGGIGGERRGQTKKEGEEEEGSASVAAAAAAAATTAGAGGDRASGSGLEPGVGLWGSGCLRLELSGEEIRPGDLENPVIVVANYVFDSLKQDAFRWGDCYASLKVEGGWGGVCLHTGRSDVGCAALLFPGCGTDEFPMVKPVASYCNFRLS